MEPVCRLMLEWADLCDIGKQDPIHCGYGWHTPLLVRAVEKGVSDEWRDRSLESLNGKLLEARHHDAVPGEAEVSKAQALVVIIGGCSQSELASLEALSKKLGREFLVITSAVLSGQQFMQSLNFDWAH